MSYLRPSGGTINVTGPEIEETYRAGAVVSKSNVWKYEGTEAEINAQRITDIAAGATRVNKAPSGNGLWTLSSFFPFSIEEGEPGQLDEPQNLHEIEIQVEQISAYNSVRLRAYMSGTTAQKNYDIALVKTFVDRFLAGDYKDANGNPDIDTAATELKTLTNDDTKSEALFRRVLAGTDSAIEYRSVYRRTITAATWQQVQASYEGVGKIWTTAEVEAFEGIPTSEWFGLNPGMNWIKAPPSVTAAVGGKTQIQYFYTEFKLATNLLYEAYSGATMLD